MTVAILLDQVGGACEARFYNRPLKRSRYGAGQIQGVPPAAPLWGYEDSFWL
ncbi:MAG: hypothetical protein WB869_18875 [Candidatus Acidiferrales bacterium]